MELLLATLVGVILACAVHLLLSRDLFRVLLGAMLLTSGANLAVVVVGRIRRAAPAFVPSGTESIAVDQVANPLPQAFVLTAIVIGFALFAFVLALLVPLVRMLGTLDVDAQRLAEPPPDRAPVPTESGPP